MQIVLYSDDINLLSYWESFLQNTKTVDTLEELYNYSDVLIILNYSTLKTQAEQVLKTLKLNKNSILILDRTPNINTAKQLLLWGANGYGNALMKEHFVLFAIDTIQDGMVWLHPEFTSELINEITKKESKDIEPLLSVLSAKEKEVALLLKEGDTYKTIASKLNITPRTVKAHASSIYTKLKVKDRLSLALLLR